jgi:hypothetical protein
MSALFDFLIFAAILAVTVTLGFGIFSLHKGGEQAASRSNKLMRLRVALQAVAIVLLCLGMWWKSTQAG